MSNEFIEVTKLYGFMPTRLADVSGVRPMYVGVPPAAKTCDYCGLGPGNGAHKCLNCGAPK